MLERGFVNLQLSGEISNFSAPASGHWYFTLKDEHAQVRAAMWRGNNRGMRFRPANGMQVLVRARVSLYEPRGDYQLIVEHMSDAGEGALKQQFEQLQMRLAAEGLFHSGVKKPLPQHIQKVGIITSATGAAIRDVLSVLKRRAPQLEPIIYPCQVQGKDAHLSIIKRLKQANEQKLVDLVLLTRGGGSLEDMWCFNEEALARAIYHSDLPVISAVGHEIDTTISDFVADVRAPTPSAAAELISPDSSHLVANLTAISERLMRLQRQKVTEARAALTGLSQRLHLCHPKAQYEQQSQRVDELQQRLYKAQQRQFAQAEQRLAALSPRLQRANPQWRFADKHAKLQHLRAQLTQKMQSALAKKQHTLGLLSQQLEGQSPLKVLSRGYSVTEHQGKVLTTATDVNPGDTLTTRLKEGQIESQVTRVIAPKQP